MKEAEEVFKEEDERREDVVKGMVEEPFDEEDGVVVETLDLPACVA